MKTQVKSLIRFTGLESCVSADPPELFPHKPGLRGDRDACHQSGPSCRRLHARVVRNETAGTGRWAQQLRLPFASRFFIDENLPRRELGDALRRIGASVTSSSEAGMLGRTDDVVSRSLDGNADWVITSDRGFHYMAGKPMHVVVLLGTLIADATGWDEIARHVAEECDREASACANSTGHLILLSDAGADHIQYSIPENVSRIMPVLLRKPHLTVADLAEGWGCTSATSLRRARRLCTEGWLVLHRKRRPMLFRRGSLLCRLRNPAREALERRG